jgi:hypothetical protein
VACVLTVMSVMSCFTAPDGGLSMPVSSLDWVTWVEVDIMHMHCGRGDVFPLSLHRLLPVVPQIPQWISPTLL